MIKKFLIIISILGVCFFALLLYFYIQAENNRKLAKSQQLKTVVVVGDSMEPLGYKNGDYLDARISNSCEVNDVCSFTCISDKCAENKGVGMLKRVTKKDGNSYWFEGRDDEYDIRTENGTRYWNISFDSTYYGWMENEKDIVIDSIIQKNEK